MNSDTIWANISIDFQHSLMLKKYNFLVMSEPSILDFSNAQKIQLFSVVEDINPS